MRQVLLSTLLPLAVALIPADQVIAQPAAARMGAYSRPPFTTPVFDIFLVIEVHLPVESAVVFVDGNPTISTGAIRMYSTPSLEGENSPHEIRAEWFENGAKVSRTRITGGKAGQKIIVDFVEK